MDSQVSIFYGPAGSGKGTQANLLVKYLKEKEGKKVIYEETGQKFRDFLRSGTFTSKLTKEVLDKGGLLPAFLPIWIWTSFFNDNFTGSEHLVLDGLCRRQIEAPVLDSALQFYNLKNNLVFVLNVSRQSLIKRLELRARYDDTLESINKRIDWYEQEVIPTINFFRNNPHYSVFDIDAEKTVEEIHKDILNHLKFGSK